MTRNTTTTIILLAAAAALAGCSKGHTIIAGGEPNDVDANTAALNGPVALPPSIMSSKIYRCADNQVVYVDWLSDNQSANIRMKTTAPPTHVTAAAAGQPMSGPGGYELSGTPGASLAKIAVPGHPSQSCKA